MKTYLKVPYAEKDRAKKLGARFDMNRKQWYCPDGIDLMLFKEWFTFSYSEPAEETCSKNSGRRTREGSGKKTRFAHGRD